MLSSRVYQVAILRGGCSHCAIVNSSRSRLRGEKFIFDRRLSKTFHNCRRPLYSHLGQQYSTVRDKNDGKDSLPRPKESLLNKIRSSHRKYEILSLPNIITTSRALMAPAMGYFIINNMHSYALVCLTYAAVSDVMDKAVAYYTNQASPLNTTMDALADKLLIVTSCIALYKMDIMSIFVLKSVVVRDSIIVAGGATIRYNGFDEKPTLRKYLDVNNYPTLCFQVAPINRFVTGLQYSVIMAHLAFNHMTGDPTYDWAIFLWQGVALSMSSISVAWYLTNFMKPKFLTRPPGR